MPNRQRRTVVAACTVRASMTATQDEQATAPSNGPVRVRQFDADRHDQLLEFDDALASKPTERQLLWIDIAEQLDKEQIHRLAEALALDRSTVRALQTPGDTPHLAIHGTYLHIRVAVEPNDRDPDATPWLDIVGGGNVVITSHRRHVKFLDDMDDRIQADTTFGLLDASTFMASLLSAAVTSYFTTVDAIEDDVDLLDAKSLRDVGGRKLLDDLVVVRRRIARLRRILTDHRQVFALVGGAELAKLTDNPDSAAAFNAVAERFESAIGAVEDSREVLIGSFDVYMTRTAQRTNDVMKVLALATVLLLPGSLVAGLLGMNVIVPLPENDPMSWWVVVVGVIVFAIFILLLARVRRWL
jgi:magnesium transporter